MNVLDFTLVVFAGSLFAGFLGSLTGLGGGVVIVPLLTVALGVDVHYAIGASLVSVIATSSGAAAAYLKEGFTNMRVGIFLEVGDHLGSDHGRECWRPACRDPPSRSSSASCCSSPSI